MTDNKIDWSNPDHVRHYSEHAIRVWSAKAPADATLGAAHLAGLLSFAALAINAAIILNGAAATAVIALLGTLWGASGPDAFSFILPAAVESLKAFGIGAASAVAASGLAYLSQAAFVDLLQRNIDFETQKLNVPPATPDAAAVATRDRIKFWAETFRFVAILLFVISLGAFIYGAKLGLDNLESLVSIFSEV